MPEATVEQDRSPGPEPCITGPAKCNRQQVTRETVSSDRFDPDKVKVLAWGMDALYTTYDGNLEPWLETALDSLKQEAQQDDAPVVFPQVQFFGEPVMIHQRGGVRGYRYHLSNSKCDAFLVGAVQNQPALWLQPRAEYLREVGPVRLVHYRALHKALLSKPFA